jgi:hypothetical protein
MQGENLYKKGKMLHRAIQIETLKSVHKNGVQYSKQDQTPFIKHNQSNLLFQQLFYLHNENLEILLCVVFSLLLVKN